MSVDKSKAIFLLGGYDLEMVTIRDVLIQNGFELKKNLFDKELSWGAKLSDYQDVIEANKDKDIYAIELEIDDKSLKCQYGIKIIDHHGEDHNHKPASLLQILKLLDIEPSEEQKIIAANDARYIPGMLCLNVDEKTIKEVRKKDRRIQGVTEDDDLIAIENVKNDRETINGVDIVYATTSKFSSITDVLYIDEKSDKPCIIYTDNEMAFYGFSVDSLIQLCEKQNIKENKYYFGGGDKGYFGFKEDALEKDDFLAFKDDLLKTLDSRDDLYSTHIFMFPFIFDKDAIDVNRILGESKKWKKRVFDLSKDHRNYNEYTYFYEYARKALYNLEDNDTDTTSTYFEYADKEGKFIVNVKGKSFILELDGIALRTFDTGIAILSIEVLNKDYPNVKDVLQINDFGRRLYPQFVSEHMNDETKYSLEHVKNALHPCSVALHIKNEEKVEEIFAHYTSRNNLKNDATQMPNYIHHLLGEKFASDKKDNESIHIEPIIDDRMFVMSMYLNTKLSNEMKKYNYVKNEYAYENSDFWYEYIFVDGGGITCTSKHMKQRLINEASYDRWVEEGTLFGISRYSFVLLSNNDWFANNVLKVHMYTMYFQIFSLLLAYRASILKFSHRVAIIDVNKYNDNNLDELQDTVSTIYGDYINFQNNLFFREVTAQDQGIELYNKALGIMQIKEQITDLDKEIEELHTYVSMRNDAVQAKEADKREQRLETISKLGAVFLPPSLLAGLFGMNVFDFNQSGLSIILVLIFMVLSSILGYFLITNSEKNDQKKTNVKAPNKEYIGLIGLVFISIILLYFSYASPNNAQDVNIKNQNTIMQKVVNYFNKLQNNKGENSENNQTK